MAQGTSPPRPVVQRRTLAVTLAAVFATVLVVASFHMTSSKGWKVSSGERVVEAEMLVTDYGLDANAAVAKHNALRTAVGLAPVQWSTAIADFSASWAAQLKSQGCGMQHSTQTARGAVKWEAGTGIGENLAWSSGYDRSIADSIQAWYDEINSYNYGKIGDACTSKTTGAATGHFTQVMWATSTYIGCAKASCSSGAYITVCNYGAQGNFVGQTPFDLTVANKLKLDLAKCGFGTNAPTAAAPVTTAPTVSSAMAGSKLSGAQGCIAAKSVGTCGNCLNGGQCSGTSFCCPFMKKCVPSSSTPCSAPVAMCQPTCFNDDPLKCTTCTAAAWPYNWQLPTCTGPTAAPVVTPAPTAAPTNAPTVAPTLAPGAQCFTLTGCMIKTNQCPLTKGATVSKIQLKCGGPRGSMSAYASYGSITMTFGVPQTYTYDVSAMCTTCTNAVFVA